MIKPTYEAHSEFGTRITGTLSEVAAVVELRQGTRIVMKGGKYYDVSDSYYSVEKAVLAWREQESGENADV